MQCQYSRCQIAFHIECARRANYCMEIEKRGDPKDPLTCTSTTLVPSGNGNFQGKPGGSETRDKSYRVFCEKHRPLKIVKEMEERDQATIEEIQRFCKILDKCMEIDER